MLCDDSSARYPKILDIPEAKWTVYGWSRGGCNTGFFIPELKLYLDCQVSTPFCPDHILITHGHTDHTLWLANKLASNNVSDPVIYAPIESVALIENFVDAAFRMGTCDPAYKTHFKFVGVRPMTESHRIKNDAWMWTYDMCHRVPARGYGLGLRRTKLKTEYKNMKGMEIAALRRGGTDVMEEYTLPMLAYVTDTGVGAYAQNPDLLKYKYVMAECTFIKTAPPDEFAKELELAHKGGHTHWAELRLIAEAHPETTFVLIHFSLRYTNAELVMFRDSLKDKIKNVIVPV